MHDFWEDFPSTTVWAPYLKCKFLFDGKQNQDLCNERKADYWKYSKIIFLSEPKFSFFDQYAR